MKTYQEQIGDGKLPNKYWVFQYDQKYKRTTDTDGIVSLDIIKEDTETTDSLLGELETFREALQCVDNKSYLPNVVIEDRLSGHVFEQRCIVCQECGKEEYETQNDTRYSQKVIEEAGLKFE